MTRWERRHVAPEEHVFVVQHQGGDLAAYLQAAPFADGSPRLAIDIVVLPIFRQRGIGTALLGMAEERARLYATQRLSCPVFIAPGHEDPAGAGFLLNRGFRTDSGYWQLRLDTIGKVQPPVWPPGVTVRTATETPEDAEKWSSIVELAFREITPPAAVLAQMREPGAAPEGYFFVLEEATGKEIGTGRARIDIVGGVRIGYVATVGVVPEHRGRGIAEALVRQTLRHLACLGVDSASLFVERENNAARRLYDKMGWYPTYRTDHYWRAVSDQASTEGQN